MYLDNILITYFVLVESIRIFAVMSVEKILSDFNKKSFQPVYWLEGEEPFFIDAIVNYAEHKILSIAEAEFNLTVFYGKDADWVSVVNACRRYPMFAERQVVILKEAQQMRGIEKLESYINNPLSSTVFIISYKDKKIDGRSVFGKMLKQKTEFFSTKKIYDNQLPEWASQEIHKRKLTISERALTILVDHIGNDLSRIQNEIEKLAVNLGNRKNITEDDIENYIGVSKEFNVFEMQDAIAKKNFSKAIRIIQYFEANPKAVTIHMLLPTLYNFFSKVFMIFGVNSSDEKTIAASLGINAYFIKDYIQAARNYSYAGVENILLLLHEYNLRSVGIRDQGTSDAGLIKEMVVKMIY